MEAPLTDSAVRVLQAIRERAMDGYTVCNARAWSHRS